MEKIDLILFILIVFLIIPAIFNFLDSDVLAAFIKGLTGKTPVEWIKDWFI